MTHERRALDICTTPPLTPTATNDGTSLDHDDVNCGEAAAAEWKGKTNNVEYTLKPATRAYASTARLNLQHYIWKDQTGFLLHPTIPLDGRTDLKIADVGTGTGIWLLDLARTLPPTAQLDGFDIDISDCPAAPWLPPNVRMRHLDALGQIPEDLIGVYDIVQLRLFQVVVRDNDPGPLLRNAVSMLKPNGHLQWSEYDPSTQHTILASPHLPHTTLSSIPTYVSTFTPSDPRIGSSPSWIPSLPLLFSTLTNGTLTEITSWRYATSPAWLPYQLDVFLLTYEELAGKVLDHLEGGEGDRLRGLIEGGKGEGRRGVGWGMERLVVVGRKVGGGGDAIGEDVVAGGGGEKRGVGEGTVKEEKGEEQEERGKKTDNNGKGNENGNLKQPSPSPSPSESAVVVAFKHKNQERTRPRRREKWVRVWKRLSFSR